MAGHGVGGLAPRSPRSLSSRPGIFTDLLSWHPERPDAHPLHRVLAPSSSALAAACLWLPGRDRNRCAVPAGRLPAGSPGRRADDLADIMAAFGPGMLRGTRFGRSGAVRAFAQAAKQGACRFVAECWKTGENLMFKLQWLRARGVCRGKPGLPGGHGRRLAVLGLLILTSLLETGCQSGPFSPCGCIGRRTTALTSRFRRNQGDPCCGSGVVADGGCVSSGVPVEAIGAPIIAPAIPGATPSNVLPSDSPSNPGSDSAQGRAGASPVGHPAGAVLDREQDQLELRNPRSRDAGRAGRGVTTWPTR